jgi:hypothetical protein
VTWAAALFVVVAFIALAGLLQIPVRAQEVLGRSRRALADLRDPALEERAKERAVQGHALRLLWLFVVLTLSATLALALPLGVIALLDSAGLVSLRAVLELTVSWPFLIGTFVLGFAVWGLLRQRPA